MANHAVGLQDAAAMAHAPEPPARPQAKAGEDSTLHLATEREEGASAAPEMVEKDEEATAMRLHTTVRLNQFTLQFEDAELERAYKAFSHRRKKALWLRSLVPATAFHILFGLSDCIEHPLNHLLVTIPARVFLSVLQVSMFILVRWDLVAATETTMLFVSIFNGIPTLLLYALQRTSLHQWDALFVVFGLSFYTIPKITPLGFVASLVGSWFTAALYAGLSFLVRPPVRPFESLLGFLYCAPVIGIFNTISYYSEYNSRERFVLRRRLRSESITLAVSRTKTLPHVVSSEATDQFFKTNKFTLGFLLWAATTISGWTSLPEVLKFVDEETGWAWFSHCAGLTVFLLVMTRQLQWLFVVPVAGAVMLWMLTLALPASWIIVSAHSVGYGLLLASIVIAMGVFSRFVSVWRELVAFLTRSCFLYPQLQAGLQDEYPLLVKIVSEYTAGMDPSIISSRDSNNRSMLTNHAASPSFDVMTRTSVDDHCSPTMQGRCRPSPRRRSLATAVANTALKNTGQAVRAHHHQLANKGIHTRTLIVEPKPVQEEEEEAFDEGHDTCANKMVSVLPSFKAGKCFFCSKNEAEHLVPACGMWGKWTHWRMSQQQDILFGSLALPGPTGGATGAVGKPVATMCTSYYEVQEGNAQLSERVESLEKENQRLVEKVEAMECAIGQANSDKIRLQAELRATHEKYGVELQRQQASLQKQMDQILEEANHTASHNKMQLREAEKQSKKLANELATARAALIDRSSTRESTASEQEQVRVLQDEVEALKKQLAEAHDRAVESANVSSPASTATISAVQPSRRLPYARWLEIEGLRESVGKNDREDGSPSWSFPSQ